MSGSQPPTAPPRSGAIGVLGLWHLGSVTAACLAEAGNEVIGFDPDPAVVTGLANGRPPVYEPGLAELIAHNTRRLRFCSDEGALAEVARAWIAFDTPVDQEDRADVEWVLDRASRLLARLPAGALVIVSSQLPAGSVAQLRTRCAAVRGDRGPLRFACLPENLRLGSALESFRAPERIVAGVSSEEDRRELAELLAPFSTNVLWMRVESAEMLKHALNGFLATSIAFINEIASICESVGADAAEVAQGLKSDARIGPRAYLDHGEAFAGGTLARDLGFLRTLAERHGLTSHVSLGVLAGNAEHRWWTRRRLLELLDLEQEEDPSRALAGLNVAVWGLAYKPGTDTLRRSDAVELCRWLARSGAKVRAHDPAVHALPASLSGVLELCPSPLDAAAGARVLIVCSACPEFREPAADELLAALAPQPLILDPAGWLADGVADCEDLSYARVGNPGPPTSGSPAPSPSIPPHRARQAGGLMSGELAGRTALITGATRGLGLQIARDYLRAGVHGLCICGRDPAAVEAALAELSELAGADQRVLGVPADVSLPEDVERLVQSAVTGLGELTILVSNAGVYGPKGPVQRNDWSEWARAIEINLFGSVLPARALTPHFIRRGYGKILQLSGGGATRPLPGVSAYAASKAAVVRFAETLAMELREHHIDVNAIAPGALNTRMLDEVLAAGPEAVGQDFHERAREQQRSGGVPLRHGAELAVFLASSASDGITGKLLSAVWDPWLELPRRRSELDSDLYTLRRIVPGDRGLDWGGA